MLRPSPNHRIQWLHNDDDDDDSIWKICDLFMMRSPVISMGWTLCRPNVCVIKHNRQKDASFTLNIVQKIKPAQYVAPLAAG